MHICTEALPSIETVRVAEVLVAMYNRVGITEKLSDSAHSSLQRSFKK